MSKLRVAEIQLWGDNIKRVEAYLYDNFSIHPSTSRCEHSHIDPDIPKYAIVGADVAGWTLEAQCDRLASGLIFAWPVR